MYNCNFVAKKLEHNNTKPTKTIGKVKVSQPKKIATKVAKFRK